MQLDGRDLTILRLAGSYRWLPYGILSQLGLISRNGEISLLVKLGLLSLSSKNRYIKLTQQGYDTLHKHGYDYDPGSKRAYANSAALRRRLEVSSVALTALRAGIDVLPDDIDALSSQPTFFPAFSLRTGGSNLMNAANCAGFGHWGDNGYMLQYVSPDSCGMYLTNELSHFHNLSPIFDSKLKTKLSMILAGSSYSDIYKQLSGNAPSSRHGKHGFHDFWDVCRKTDMPIHLLSCDGTGAMQLAIMRQPDYNARIAKAAFGGDWNQYDDNIPDADGSVNGNPLVIAADVDKHRVERICKLARSQGRSEVMIAALKNQLEDFYKPCFPKGSLITLLSIGQPVLDDAFGKGLSLFSMEDD